MDRHYATLKEAMRAGYRCSPPDCKPRGLAYLCDRLGPAYHLASFNELPGCEKDIVIQRVIGGGYDVEIYNCHRGRCAIVLWAGYGSHTVDEVRGVPYDQVEYYIMRLVDTHCPPDVRGAFWNR